MTEPAHATEAEEPLPQEPRISYVVARLERAIRQAINDRVKEYGLTTLQYTTLSVLGRRGELSNAQLARRAFMTPQSMSEVIHALEGKGLIKRSPHPNHRKTLPARVTAKGRRVLAVCDEAVSDFEDSMLEGFSEKDRAAFLGMVTAAVRNLGGGFPSEEKPSSVRGT